MSITVHMSEPEAAPGSGPRIDLGRRPRILLVRLSAIGDVVVTTPVSRALRAAFPDAWLAWLVEPKARDVVEGNRYLDEVIVWQRHSEEPALKTLATSLLLARRLRREAFDAVIDFQGLLRSALVSCLSGARWRIGNLGTREPAERFYNIRVPKPAGFSSRQRCLDLLRPLGVRCADRRMVLPIGEQDRAAAANLLRQSREDPSAPYACLVPASTWPHKHWLDERWSEVADRLAEELGMHSVLLGGPQDRDRTARIAAGARTRPADLGGRTTLNQAAAVLEGARVAIVVDTGLMHIAVAVGTPTVALCGASWWPGFQDYENFCLLRTPMPCSPCLRHPICRAVDCMRAIQAADPVTAARRLLERGGR
ncbi:MAG: glycosyltransferase family 9 protein [Armatimonadetes bacterium]|nr:glycosyltransferase family 9 protein [Armatimonadota bacterium]